jgi:hypothetical protein
MADDAPKLTDHWKKIVFLLLFMVAWLGISILVFGGHRISADMIPLDASSVGPNILASFVWLPVAFLGGWIVSEVRNIRNMEQHRVLLAEHEQRVKGHLDRHTLKMAELLGVSGNDDSDALNATPGDRRLDDVS